jgi:hypothetical protein
VLQGCRIALNKVYSIIYIWGMIKFKVKSWPSVGTRRAVTLNRVNERRVRITKIDCDDNFVVLPRQHKIWIFVDVENRPIWQMQWHATFL